MKNVLMAALVLGACADSDGSGGFGGSDSLPKRGERETDPTIVSAIARCELYSSGSYLVFDIIASDPSGELGSCHGTVADVFNQNTFGDDNDCLITFSVPCASMQEVTIDLTVANDRAGLTDAIVTLPVKH